MIIFLYTLNFIDSKPALFMDLLHTVLTNHNKKTFFNQKKFQGLEVWLKWQGACFASTKP
jgi:hypothetical protein